MLFHLPQLVEAGKVYKLMPPLYKITKNKKDIYFNDNKEYARYVEKDIVKNITIYAIRNKKKCELTEDEIVDLIINTKDYLSMFDKLAKNNVMNGDDKILFEFILMNLHFIKNGKVKKFTDNIKKFGRDLEVIDNWKDAEEVIVMGIYNFEAQFIRINEKFIKKASDITTYLDNPDNDLYFNVNGEDIQLYQLLSIFESYKPDGRQRYKGLGEMNPDQLGETCFVPGNRHLIKLTIGDLERDKRIFNILHSPKINFRNERKKLMSKFKINPEDLDG